MAATGSLLAERRVHLRSQVVAVSTPQFDLAGTAFPHRFRSYRSTPASRLATHFRRGPFFLTGDAIHQHSPADGQGMNAGIQDALNYRPSPLSVEGVPRARAGPLLGSRLAETEVTCEGVRVRVHALLAAPGVHILLQAGVLIVRPDGYVGFRAASADPRQIADWLSLVGLGPSRA